MQQLQLMVHNHGIFWGELVGIDEPSVKQDPNMKFINFCFALWNQKIIKDILAKRLLRF